MANDDFNIFFEIQLLKQTNVFKFLGVYLDEHLTWKNNISFFIKANRKIRWCYILISILPFFKNPGSLVLFTNLSLHHLL